MKNKPWLFKNLDINSSIPFETFLTERVCWEYLPCVVLIWVTFKCFSLLLPHTHTHFTRSPIMKLSQRNATCHPMMDCSLFLYFFFFHNCTRSFFYCLDPFWQPAEIPQRHSSRANHCHPNQPEQYGSWRIWRGHTYEAPRRWRMEESHTIACQVFRFPRSWFETVKDVTALNDAWSCLRCLLHNEKIMLKADWELPDVIGYCSSGKKWHNYLWCDDGGKSKCLPKMYFQIIPQQVLIRAGICLLPVSNFAAHLRWSESH